MQRTRTYTLLLRYCFILSASQLWLLTTCQLSTTQTLVNTWNRFINQSKLTLPQIISGQSIGQKNESPNVSPSSRYDYEHPTHLRVEETSDNLGEMGFMAQACYPHPSQADGEEFCIFLNLEFNDGRGLSILIQPSTLPELVWHHAVLDSRRRVFSAPDRKTNPWKSGDIRGKNRGGVTATRKLGISDLVFYAHPLLIVTGEHSWPAEIWGKVLQNMVDVLPYESRQRISRMYGVGETTSEWFRSVFDLSGFDLEIGPDDFGATVIIPEAAAFRHNCRPNVVWHIDAQTLEFHMYPLREILKGEELTISFISVVAEWEERQNALKEFYNLSCTCAQCRLPPPERERADNQIRRILHIHDVLANWNKGSNASIEMAEELLTLHKIQNLDQDLPEAYCLAAREYNAVGNVRKARQYASLALSKAIYIHGNGWRMAQDAKQLESFPENHWSHQRRLQV